METIDIRKVIIKEGVKVELENEVKGLRAQMEEMKNQYIAEIENVTEDYYMESEKNDQLREEISLLKEKITLKDRFVKSLLKRLRKVQMDTITQKSKFEITKTKTDDQNISTL